MVKHSARTLYLGWGNPKTAYSFDGIPIALLIDADGGYTFLEGGRAKEFLGTLRALTHHLCGVEKTPEIRELIDSTKPHKHNHPAYESVFDKYFVKNMEGAH